MSGLYLYFIKKINDYDRKITLTIKECDLYLNFEQLGNMHLVSQFFYGLAFPFAIQDEQIHSYISSSCRAIVVLSAHLIPCNNSLKGQQVDFYKTQLLSLSNTLIFNGRQNFPDHHHRLSLLHDLSIVFTVVDLNMHEIFANRG